MDRWAYLRDAIASVHAQSVTALEVIVVIDHNQKLMSKAASEIPEVKVVANRGSRGASGARNTGATLSNAEVIAFLDDDEVASPTWLENLLRHFQNPAVVGAGGRLMPRWNTHPPGWFPEEFHWAVGCSYRGMPENVAAVRNVWSGNMAIRRQVFESIGGFRDEFGKVGDRNRPEDTDLCMRAAEFSGRGKWIYDPDAGAYHQVPAERGTLRFFLRRCFNEGQGKAVLASMNGISGSTSEEIMYVRRVLPHGVARGLLDAVRGKVSGLTRSAMILIGLSLVTVGFVSESAIGFLKRRRKRPTSLVTTSL